MDKFDLAAYLSNSVEKIVKNILRATLKDPRESAFMIRYNAASREAASRRAQYEKDGEHIPPFLIASITSSCNLHCAGCYARHNNACAAAICSRESMPAAACSLSSAGKSKRW